ncbi:MAG: tetratricopeptide repeat protein [Candidatus Eisenbacteria bacterium]
MRREGRPSEAAALYREALGRMREVYPDDHPQIAVTLNNLASALESEGDLEAAERTYREALDLQQRVLGPDHRDVGTTVNNLAGLMRQLRRYEESEELYREALRIYSQALGPDHAWVSIVWNNLAHTDEAREDYGAALAATEEAERIGRLHWPEGHWRIEQSMSLRGACLAAEGRDDEAEPLLSGSLQRLRATLPETDGAVVRARERWATFLESRNRVEEATRARAEGHPASH